MPPRDGEQDSGLGPTVAKRPDREPDEPKYVARPEAVTAAAAALQLDRPTREEDEGVLPFGLVIDPRAAGLDLDRPDLEPSWEGH